MEIKPIIQKTKSLILKYKYAIVVLLIGLCLLMIPEKKENNIEQPTEIKENNLKVEVDTLSEILQTIDGAGCVRVLLSIASDERTQYQTNQDISTSENNSNSKIETVIITDSQRNEAPLIAQKESPIYRGAIVVCQGADSPAVKLSITQAVSKITGLSTDNICVLKMK